MEPRQHLNPVWRKKANYLLMAEWYNEDEKEYEQLWSKKISSNTFEICCIPFFVYDISLGDIVSANDENIIVDIITSSGRSTIRVWFGDSISDYIKEDVLKKTRELNCMPEWYSDNLLAIDISTLDDAQNMILYLQEQESNRFLTYEIGKLFQS